MHEVRAATGIRVTAGRSEMQGWVELPETPGFGIEVDEACGQDYRVDR
jgi:L-alanine-DL-glutamate epimerase-like enolase superfamily enzyme